MTRFLAGVATALAAVAAIAPSAAATSTGAQLAVTSLTPKLAAKVVITDAAGGSPATVFPLPGQGVPKPFLLSAPTWSGDGRFLITTGISKPVEPSGAGAVRLYAVPVEGGPPVAVPHTSGALYPVGFPDGQTVAFTRVRGSESESISVEVGSHKEVRHHTRLRYSLWVARIDGLEARRITRWRTNGYEIPTSVSPDGSTLALVRLTIDRSKRKPPRGRSQAVLLDLVTGRSKAVGPHIDYAAFSPDGSRLAVVKERDFPRPHVTESKQETTTIYGETDIYVEDLATGGLRQVTGGPADDGGPAWDPSGQRLAFVRYGGARTGEAALFGIGDGIYEVNADGSCQTRVLHQEDAAFVGPAWRPGPERGAGPILC